MLKVIIADDERLICKLIQNLVDWELLEMEVAGSAENGLEALELIRSKRPDILITDIRMPGCDGLELIRHAKQILPDLEVVIISGYAHFEYARSALTYGACCYLLKPIKQAELMETLDKIGERCRYRQEGESTQLSRNSVLRDVNRIRESLMKDLLSEPAIMLTEEILKDSYHINTAGGLYQAFMIKADYGGESAGIPLMSGMQEKCKDTLNHVVLPACRDMVLIFQSHTGYGLLRYDFDKKEEVRTRLRESLNQMEVKKSLLGFMEVTLSLGNAVECPSQLAQSLERAKAAMDERLVEGTGRLLASVPIGSGKDKQRLLERYVKAAEHSLESLDREAAKHACETLKEEALSLNRICGREMLELVLSAGRVFITRTAGVNADEVQREFVQLCSRCGSVSQLFDQLSRLQDRLLTQVEDLDRSEATRPIRNARQYVAQHYSEPITLDAVCDHIGFSPSYFSMLFKRETGEGFAKYLTKVRIEEAKTLLRETNVPIAEICNRVGYSDRKHFTHTFHKATGLNPVQYRKLYG